MARPCQITSGKCQQLSENKTLNSEAIQNFNIEKVLEDTRSSMRKEGVNHKVIPKFCDLQLGNSSQLADIFTDVERLYKNPGYLLQQCAYYNNIFHFNGSFWASHNVW